MEWNLKQEIERLQTLNRNQSFEFEKLKTQLSRSIVLEQKLEDEKRESNNQFLKLRDLFEETKNNLILTQNKLKEQDEKIKELETDLFLKENLLRKHTTNALFNNKSIETVAESKNKIIENLEQKIQKRNSKISKLKNENVRFVENKKIVEEEVEILKSQISEINNLRRKGMNGFQAECVENQSLRERA